MKDLIIGFGELSDYGEVEKMMQQVHSLHLEWRPDIYKPADTIYPLGYFEKPVEE